MASSKYTTPVFKKDQPDDSYKFQPLPKPTGQYPFRLPIQEVMPGISEQKLVFHMVGDTGSIRNPDYQRLVANAMRLQYTEADGVENKPQFLYHLGDVVYNHGEAIRYDDQFFTPYQTYPGEIFAIPGNHDSDVNPESQVPYHSLEAFKTVFCDTQRRQVPFSNNSNRLSIVQPNVYWTLQTSLANIIGLCSNVPKYGIITSEQREWFINELKAADAERPDKALLVCLHHAPYTADINHGSSQPMISFLEDAFEEAGVRPNLVLSGHVHNYQRLCKTYADGVSVPFIVAGGGGYDELHAIAATDDERFTNDSPLLNDVKLEQYVDNRHGFLKITIEKENTELTLTGEYYTLPHELPEGNETEEAVLADRFTINII
ncbi:metallophosphoesterase [Mucilaginibacter sp. Bleaf8]|uniref:metallophosphoesterase family protein n=1 Tax=Mucilaginibacter sp. Bleaf8 TaxID=2834430 RepID=UPI001BCED82D|nr:metallophosphoesterase [Mucilaginibacter sp. Bleaf8]MBS7564935.1 metallophosphoesterase [Mucilaginibacter sp. Bleaf8]